MAFNPVPPLKNDSAEGFEEDFDPNSDVADVRGLVIQNDSSSDTSVQVTRNGSNDLVLTDPNAGSYTLSQIPTKDQHKALRQLIHFIEEGPADGFASGAYKTVTYSGIFPINETWYEDNTMAEKIVEVTTTYSGILVSTEEWKMYDTDGTTVLATVTDSYTYSGLFEATRTRTIA